MKKLKELIELRIKECEERLQLKPLSEETKILYKTRVNTFIEIQNFINRKNIKKVHSPPYQDKIIKAMKDNNFWIEIQANVWRTPVFAFKTKEGDLRVEKLYSPPTKTIIKNWIKKGILEIENHEGIERIVLTEKYKT